jgi:hypothetical protein
VKGMARVLPKLIPSVFNGYKTWFLTLSKNLAGDVSEQGTLHMYAYLQAYAITGG